MLAAGDHQNAIQRTDDTQQQHPGAWQLSASIYPMLTRALLSMIRMDDDTARILTLFNLDTALTADASRLYLIKHTGHAFRWRKHFRLTLTTKGAPMMNLYPCTATEIKRSAAKRRPV